MGNIFRYNNIDSMLYQTEIDKDIFLCVKTIGADIIEVIRIFDNKKIYEGKLIHCNEVSPNLLSYSFENNISLAVFKDNPSFYKLTYNKITIKNVMYKVNPINFFSENIDKIYKMINN